MRFFSERVAPVRRYRVMDCVMRYGVMAPWEGPRYGVMALWALGRGLRYGVMALWALGAVCVVGGVALHGVTSTHISLSALWRYGVIGPLAPLCVTALWRYGVMGLLAPSALRRYGVMGPSRALRYGVMGLGSRGP